MAKDDGLTEAERLLSRPTNRVRELRELNRMSQRDLGRRLGMSGPEVHKLETGQRLMKAWHLEKLADVFGCSQEEIMGRAPAPTSAEAAQIDTMAELKRIDAKLGRICELLEELVAQGRRDRAA